MDAKFLSIVCQCFEFSEQIWHFKTKFLSLGNLISIEESDMLKWRVFSKDREWSEALWMKNIFIWPSVKGTKQRQQTKANLHPFPCWLAAAKHLNSKELGRKVFLIMTDNNKLKCLTRCSLCTNSRAVIVKKKSYSIHPSLQLKWLTLSHYWDKELDAAQYCFLFQYWY